MCQEAWFWKYCISAHAVCWIWQEVTWYSLCSAAEDLQINRFLQAFHVTWLIRTHGDSIRSCSTSWETLIFNSFGPYMCFWTWCCSRSCLILTICVCVCILSVNVNYSSVPHKTKHSMQQIFRTHTDFSDLHTTQISKSLQDTFSDISWM